MNLWQDFKINNGKVIHKWMHYFPIYEKHLSQWRNKTLTFMEIGVFRWWLVANVAKIFWANGNYRGY